MKPKLVIQDDKVVDKIPVKILDVAAGTGDIGYSILKYQQKNSLYPDLLHEEIQVTFSDVNRDILKEAKIKLPDQQVDERAVNFLVSSAENFPSIPDNTYDVYVISFGLRNVPDKQKALREAYRVLKKGGRFVCLEFSKVTNEVLNQLYK